MDKKIFYTIIIVLIIACSIFLIATSFSNTTPSQINMDVSQLEKVDNNTVTENLQQQDKLYITDKSDTNALLVENNSSTTLTNSLINKTGDTTENGDRADFYGTNSAILVRAGSQLNIKDSKIVTNSKGSNAIFVTNADGSGSNDNIQSGQPSSSNGGQPPEAGGGQPPQEVADVQKPSEQMDGQENNNMNPQENGYVAYSTSGANATVEHVEINTYQDKSRGLDATFGGNITADNILINTRGSSCAALATDRGEGTVDVKNSQINTGVDNSTGKGSPCIYSTGNISVDNTNGTAYNSQIACIEGKNSITMNDCTFNCFATGNREDNGGYVDLGGIFIYQSMSGDADIGTATFNVTDSKLGIDQSSQYYKTAPMIHTTNTHSNINIKDTTFEFGSNIFLEASGQSQWGKQGANGADVQLTTTDEKITGDIIVDSISTLNYTLTSTNYTGVINSNETIGQTNIIIADGSSWTLTGNSHISSLENKVQ